MGVKARATDGPLDPKQVRDTAETRMPFRAPAKAATDIKERRNAAALTSLERNREALALLSKA